MIEGRRGKKDMREGMGVEFGNGKIKLMKWK